MNFGNIQFSNGMVLSDLIISTVCNRVLDEIKKELPAEVRTYEVCNYILECCKENLKQKQILL